MGRAGHWSPGDGPGLHSSDIYSSLCWANLGFSLSTLTRLTLNFVSILAPWLWDWFYDAHNSGSCLKSFTSWQSHFFWTWTEDSLIQSPELPSTSLLGVNPLENPATLRKAPGTLSASAASCEQRRSRLSVNQKLHLVPAWRCAQRHAFLGKINYCVRSKNTLSC